MAMFRWGEGQQAYRFASASLVFSERIWVWLDSPRELWKGGSDVDVMVVLWYGNGKSRIQDTRPMS